MSTALRTETITDVPPENLDAVVADYAKTGARVAVEPGVAGKFTVRAEYTPESFYPASGMAAY